MNPAAGSSQHDRNAAAVAIIPARFASTRFPGKPLANQTGKFLIQHVYERVLEAGRISRALVATDDERIAEAVRGFGGLAVMTRADHPSGTDRLAEVAAGLPDEWIVNVQGDEPEIAPAEIDGLVELIVRTGCPMATLACPYPAGERADNPNLVKVVLDNQSRAIYFSRSPIPYLRDAPRPSPSPSPCPKEDGLGHGLGLGKPPQDPGPRPQSPYLLHHGVYAYRRDFLLKFAGLSPGRLERAERLEQLRALEHGYDIAVKVTAAAPAGIDTPEQYAAFVARMKR